MTAQKPNEFNLLPINRDFMFTNHKGLYNKGVEKRQTKFVNKLSIIKPFLQEGEEINLITTGCSSMSIFEQLVMGWMVVYVKRSLFVFTNKRILHIPTKTDFSYRNSIAEIVLADCASIKQKGSRLIV